MPRTFDRTLTETADWLTAVLQIARVHDPDAALCAGLVLPAHELTQVATDPTVVDPDAVRVLYALGPTRDFDDLD